MYTINDLINKRRELWDKHHDIELDKEYRDSIANYMISDNGKGLRDEIENKPEAIIEIFFIVVNKNQETVPFFLNAVQKKFIRILNKAIDDFNKGKRNHLKFLLLKGRQQGFTTVITAFQLCFAITQKNFAGFTLADNRENTESIFTDKAKYPYDHLPNRLKPTEKYNNRRELHFQKEDGKGLNSRWRVNTAGNKDVGRSKTLNFFHGSEAAFWSSIKKILTGLGEALTKASIAILESTANGFNDYKDLWDDENNWENLFFEWWETPEYRLDFESETIEKKFMDNVLNAVGSEYIDNPQWCHDRCKWLLEKKSLDWQQLYWYYNKWKDKKGDIRQEYPCTPIEAFIMSGDNYFSLEKIDLRIAELKDFFVENPYKKGYFEYEYVNEKIIDANIKWVDDPTGYITIYEEPLEGYYYVGGGDTAGEGSDWNTGAFTNNITKEDVATLKINYDEDLYARQMYCLGRYFNNALLGIETNFSTHPVKELQRLGYTNQYVREETPDKYTGNLTKRFGFQTTSKTRPLALSFLRTEFREHQERFKDIDILLEMTTFIKNEKGKPEAAVGKHDDLILARAINCYVASQQRDVADYKDEYKGPVDRLKSDLEKKIKKHRKSVR